jgi:hypothetical protein
MGYGGPLARKRFSAIQAILEAINLVICTSCMPIVSDDVLKLSQPAVIVLFTPILQYILFLSLSYVNHVYKLAQWDWNFPCSLFSLASCDTSSTTSIGSFASVVVPVSVSSSVQGFSFSDVVKNDIFGWFLPFWEAFCFHYNRDPSMKNTEYRMIIRLVYFFAWLRLRDETKIKNQSKQNKYADPGYRCTVHDVQLYGPYATVMCPTGAHIIF